MKVHVCVYVIFQCALYRPSIPGTQTGRQYFSVCLSIAWAAGAKLHNHANGTSQMNRLAMAATVYDLCCIFQ